MLVVLTTDAEVDAGDLDTALRAATAGTLRPAGLRRLHVDERHVTLMASGASGITPTVDDFTDALTQACTDLAMQLLADAEGADHEIAITVLNAATEDDAVEVGRASPAATCSRPRSSARTPTGAACSPAWAPRRRRSTRPTSTSR